MVTCKPHLTRRNSMHKLITLLVALLMIAANALAAVNVNTANEAELQMLTGIGPAKAKAIIDYRTKNGAFKSVDDLTKVPGIGPAVLGKMKNDVTLSGLTTAKTPAQAAAPVNEPAKPSPAVSPTPAPAPTATAATPTPTSVTKAPAAPATLPVPAGKAEPGKATPTASPTATPTTAAPAKAVTASQADPAAAAATSAKGGPTKAETSVSKDDAKKAGKKEKKDAAKNAEAGTPKK
jgi:competence protein ComEA